MPARKPTAPNPAPAAATPRREQPLVKRAVDRALVKRTRAAAEDVERIIEATYRVLSRSGGMDPRMREILTEAGLSTQAFYRHFTSKDELLLVVLEDGRIRLATYLGHRMAKAAPGTAQLRAWIEGMFAQAADAEAAARTRPFILNVHRLMEQYPGEQQQSIDMLVRQVHGALDAAFTAGQLDRRPEKGDAVAIYHLTVGPMETHIARGTTPTRAEVRGVTSFALRAIGAH